MRKTKPLAKKGKETVAMRAEEKGRRVKRGNEMRKWMKKKSLEREKRR